MLHCRSSSSYSIYVGEFWLAADSTGYSIQTAKSMMIKAAGHSKAVQLYLKA